MFGLITFLAMLHLCSCLFDTTPITVTNNYGQELQVKVFGLGLGGCEKVLTQGDDARCSCWWGTLDYNFCAYIPITAEPITSTATCLREQQNIWNIGVDAEEGDQSDAPDTVDPTTTDAEPYQIFGRNCPTKKGMRVLCSDLQSLGNCYGGAYACEGLCACNEVAN